MLQTDLENSLDNCQKEQRLVKQGEKSQLLNSFKKQYGECLEKLSEVSSSTQELKKLEGVEAAQVQGVATHSALQRCMRGYVG